MKILEIYLLHSLGTSCQCEMLYINVSFGGNIKQESYENIRNLLATFNWGTSCQYEMLYINVW